jgi:Fe-S cluster biosynthesis and repair protein YggX
MGKLENYWFVLPYFQIHKYLSSQFKDEQAFSEWRNLLLAQEIANQYEGFAFKDWVDDALRQPCTCEKETCNAEGSKTTPYEAKLRKKVFNSTKHQNFKRICLRRKMVEPDQEFCETLGASMKDKYRGVKKSAREESTLFFGETGNGGKTECAKHLLEVFPHMEILTFTSTNSKQGLTGWVCHGCYEGVLINDLNV